MSNLSKIFLKKLSKKKENPNALFNKKLPIFPKKLNKKNKKNPNPKKMRPEYKEPNNNAFTLWRLRKNQNRNGGTAFIIRFMVLGVSGYTYKVIINKEKMSCACIDFKTKKKTCNKKLI